MRRICKIVLLVALVLVSCEVQRPEHILSPEKMEAFLYDYHLVQSMSGEYSTSSNKEKLFFDYVFKKHNVTKEQFDTAMVWYNRYPKHLHKIYSNLEERLEKEVELLEGSAGAVMEGVAIDIAYLADDTAELWTGPQSKLLSSTPLCNRLRFSFDTPDDSSFVAGDSLVFSFSAHFIKSERDSVEQSAYAAVLLDYDDGTNSGTGMEITKSGKHSLSVARNSGSRLRAMNGFVYYSDNDSTLGSKLLLNRVSVRRIHTSSNQD